MSQRPQLSFHDSIRLLNLLHGQPDEPIRCTMTSVRLGEISKSPYHAVSYTWGSSDTTNRILVNGNYFAVTTSVSLVLSDLRSASNDRTIWIDYLCIDQSNPAERNHQVELMRRIYQSAEGVISWLGEHENDSELATQLLAEIERSLHPEEKPLAEFGWYPPSIKPPVLTDRELRALYHLFRREYWHRIWIIQEIVFAKTVTFQCGRDVISLRALRMAVDPTGYDSALWVFVRGSICLEIFEHRAESVLIDLYSLMQNYCHSRCSEIRDKVYAIIHLAEWHRGSPMLSPDYQKPLELLCDEVLAVFDHDRPKDEHDERRALDNDMDRKFLRKTLGLDTEGLRYWSLSPPDMADVYGQIEYSGVIFQRGERCALRVWRDEHIHQTWIQVSEVDGTRLWIAKFCTSVTAKEQVRVSSVNTSTCVVRGIIPRVLGENRAPSTSGRGYKIDFVASGDAENFLRVCRSLPSVLVFNASIRSKWE